MTLQPAELAEIARNRGERHMVQVGTAPTACWFYQGASAAAPTIVFVHGYRGNHHGLEAIAGALPEYNIWIPDLPGFGESPEFKDAHTITAYASWLHELVPALKLKSPVLLGHSFGTIVTSASVATGTDASAVVLVNPVSAPALKGPKAFMTYVTIAVHWLTSVLPERLGNAILKSFAFVRIMSAVMAKTRNRKLRRWIHNQHDTNFNNYASRRVATEGYLASISHNVGEYAGAIAQPTLLIAGEKDDITAVPQQQSVLKLFANGQLQVIGGVGHLTHYETPDQVADAVRAFIAKVTK